MEEIKLKRTGELPLVFTGELLKEADGIGLKGKSDRRWHVIRLYRTAQSRRYVLAIEYHTQQQGESEDYQALVLGPDKQHLIAALRSFSPIPDGIGYPRAEQFAKRQCELEEGLRRRFQVLVSEILDGIEGAEERID
jgi:hypothetical protein